jgi:hypothetical protein
MQSRMHGCTMSAFQNYIKATFADPPRSFSPVPTWWWSGERVEPDRLRWQMQQYADGGVYNLIVLNLAAAGPMYGCDADDPPFFSEAWWSVFLAACAEAERLGMQLWFYDQVGFSGANFQGRLVMRHPEWAGQALERVPLADHPPPGAQPLLRLPTHLACTVERGFDYFNPDACAALLDTIHGEFERRAGRYLGNVIAGSFQDELPSMPAWSRGFAEAFRARTGYAILDHLGALWEGHGADAERVRLDYHRVRADLAEEAFFQPLARWHEKHGLLCGCDQQTPARAAEPTGSTAQYGDYARTHRWYGAPGSDHDGHAKLHSSLAHLYGRPRVWLEAFHSTGWGGTLEETFDWLLPWLRAGITLYAPHADYYSTRGGWWEWAPPSTCWRQPYWKHYPLFAKTITRLCWLLSRGHHVCDVAVVYPTSTVQAGLTLNGPTDAARRAQDAWTELTGTMVWQRFKPGGLDQWNRDYDALDEDSLARAGVQAGRLVMGAESFSTVILPALTHLPDDAVQRLKDFAAAGGQLIALRAAPAALIAQAVVVQQATEIEALLKTRPARVESAVPLLHRRVDDLNIVLVTACRGMATTVHPPPREWWARRSYDFSPDRYASSMDVLIRGTGRVPFLLDPFSGERRAVAWRKTEDGTIATVPFDTGPAQVLAWSESDPDAEPAPNFQPLENVLATLSNHWKSELVPTVDNRHGDFTRPAHPGALPVQTWTFRHGVETARFDGTPPLSPADAVEVQAGFGRMGWRTGPTANAELDQAPWEEVVYSPSRGLFKDPVHIESLGPKGHVAEDFIHFGSTQPGQSVRFRTTIHLAEARSTHLAVGAAGAKRAWINGRLMVENTCGYWWLTPIDLAAGDNELLWEVAPEVPVNLRAAWCLVDQPAAFARPEWLTTGETPVAHSTVTFRGTWQLDRTSGPFQLQLGCDAPCRLLIDGVERGRQGGFDPYKIGMRMERYQLDGLNAGEHEVAVVVRDVGKPMQVLVDARTHTGDILMSGPGWTTARESSARRPAPLYRPTYKEPGWSHLWRRPHPLPRSCWLEGPMPGGVVVDLTPDARSTTQPAPAEWLWWDVPPGAVSMQVPSPVAFRVWMDDIELPVENHGLVRLPMVDQKRIRRVAARFEAGSGHYGGGLLSGPVTYEVGPGWIQLGDWREQGLACYAGGVRYRQAWAWTGTPEADVVLDAGRVRGTAEVAVNGRSAGARFAGPYHFAIGHLLQPGENIIDVTVYNTLAPWLEAHSPTRCIWGDTGMSGLAGPVRLLVM